MPNLLCPACGDVLTRTARTFCCPQGHSFDAAKQGYVNLLLRNGQGRRHGDDAAMVRARRAFLDRGFYDRLSQAVAAAACRYAPENVQMLDAGCGEGKYTFDVFSALSAAGKQPEAIGIDISKDALRYAARRAETVQFAVASTAALPLAAGSIDLVLNIFAPFIPEAFHRVLRPGGTLLRVYPLEKHLWELKSQIYDTPYVNPPTMLPAEGFRIAETQEIRYCLHLTSQEVIQKLFCMTPYYYKTGMADQQKLSCLARLDTAVEFGLTVYMRV